MSGYRRMGRYRRRSIATVLEVDKAFFREQRQQFLAERRTRRGWRKQRAQAPSPQGGA